MASSFHRTDDVLCILISNRNPNSTQWGAVVQAARAFIDDANAHPHARVLLITDGGVATSNDGWAAHRQIPLVVIGHPDASMLPAAWVNKRHFDVSEARAALNWLQIDAVRARAVAAVLPDLAEAAGAWEAVAVVLDVLRAIVGAASPRERVAEERAKVARVLDERLGPQLAELRGALNAFARRADGIPHLELGRLSDRVAQAGEELQGIVWAMETKARTWADVEQYVGAHVAELTNDGAVFSCTGPRDARLPGRIALHVLRIVQEGVRNAMQHASAAHINVELRYADRAVHIGIADDGRGIEGDRRAAGYGGLHHIRARAEGSGGAADLTTGTAGTRWDVTLPVGA